MGVPTIISGVGGTHREIPVKLRPQRAGWTLRHVVRTPTGHLFETKDKEEDVMATARVTKITASSPDGFQEAVNEGLSRAASTIRGITGLEVVSQKAKVENGRIMEYRVTMEVTFSLED
ncbi:MAG: dodecin family protein [Proteobacteria bacterium]|nr:dodecin family protein [Pseudomonadota bacterium]